MKQTVYSGDFRDAFRNAGRENNFSYEGLGILFDYFEEYEQSTGEEIELDVIAICCEYTEASAREIAENYAYFDEEELNEMDAEELAEEVREKLEYNTMLCGEYEAEGETFFIYADY
jgi:hypothetical protein